MDKFKEYLEDNKDDLELYNMLDNDTKIEFEKAIKKTLSYSIWLIAKNLNELIEEILNVRIIFKSDKQKKRRIQK